MRTTSKRTTFLRKSAAGTISPILAVLKSATLALCCAATQNSHSREQLDKVVEHALRHDGYAGGWLDREAGLNYFDSNRLFPEDRLEEAVRFGRENGQRSVYVLSTGSDVVIDGGRGEPSTTTEKTIDSL